MNASRRRKRRRRLFMVAALCMSALVAFVVAEVGLRVYVASRGWTPNCYVTGLAFFVPHQTAGHTLRPNLRLRSSAYDVSTNSFGLRGPEIVPQKEAGTVRVMVLGGSSVFGYLVPDGQDSCVELQRLLSENDGGSGRRVEVLNAGVPGFNVTQCRLRYTADLAALQPDWVILYLGWNDSRFVISDDPESINRTPPGPSWLQRCLIQSVCYGLIQHRLLPAEAPRFAPPERSGTVVTRAGGERFRRDYQALIEAVRSSGAHVMVSTQLMAGGESCDGLDRFLGDSQAQVEANQAIGRWISDTVRELAAENRVPLVDVARSVPCNEESLGDAIHLTRDGHRVVADAWAEALGQAWVVQNLAL